MIVVIISGFLGAGKTTVLLDLAKRFADSGKRLAIVENEVGEVGVDDARLKAEGLQVREIYSGCVCCSLRMDLVSALLEIERDYEPDVVMLEPSGVAGPKQVLAALVGYGGEIDRKVMLSIVDAGRFDKIQDMAIPLVTDGIEVADVVVVNKSDLVSTIRLGEIVARVCSVRENADVITVSAARGEGLDTLFDRLLRDDGLAVSDGASHDEKSGPKPTVCTRSCTVSLGEQSSAFGHVLTAQLEMLASDLDVAGCTLIGHVKAIASCPGGGYLVAGKTDFGEPVQLKGRLPKSAKSVALTVTAIVYGMTPANLERLVDDRLEDLTG